MSNEELYQKRDLIISEIHQDVKYLRERVDDQKKTFEDHVQEDLDFQKEIKKTMGWGIKIAVIVLIIVAANGGMATIQSLLNIK